MVELRPYIPKMEEFLKKPKTIHEIKDALQKGHIYRKSAHNAQLPQKSLSKAFAMHITWTRDLEHRLLLFLCRFTDNVTALPNDDKFVAKKNCPSPHMEGYIKPDVAVDAIKTHGTPVRLLKLFFESLGCRLVLFKGLRAGMFIFLMIGSHALGMRRI